MRRFPSERSEKLDFTASTRLEARDACPKSGRYRPGLETLTVSTSSEERRLGKLAATKCYDALEVPLERKHFLNGNLNL